MKEKDKPNTEQQAHCIDPEEVELLNDLEFMKDLEESDWEIANGKTKKWKDFKQL